MAATQFRSDHGRSLFAPVLLGTVLVLTLVLVFPASPAQASFTSSPSASATMTIASGTLAPPSGLTKSVALTSVNLNWTASSSPFVSGYYVFRDNPGGYVLLASVTGTSYTDGVSLLGGTYDYKVQAFHDQWTSSFSNVVTVTCLLFLCS